VSKLIIPFLKQQMAPQPYEVSRHQISLYDDADVDKMFGFGAYNEARNRAQVRYWSSWARRTTFDDVMIPTEGWAYQNLRGHDEGAHVCYGSTTKGSVAKMRFHAAASQCSPDKPCSVDAEYIHSWNVSYVSNVACKVFRSNEVDGKTLVNETVIDGNSYKSEAVRDTVPRMTLIATLHAGGDFEIESTNLDNKLACFSGIRLSFRV
jgi:hypothetical protein